MKLAIIQYSVDAGNIESNLEKIGRLIVESSRCGPVDLCCLPELCTTGFNWKLNARLGGEAQSTRRALARMACENQVDLCGSFLEEREDGRLVNRFLYFEKNGECKGAYDKSHLFSAFREDRNIAGGGRIGVIETTLGAIGPAICYDLRFPEIFRKLALGGAFLFTLPAAFPNPRLMHWRTLIQARAIENHAFVVGVNQCGFEGVEGSSGGTEYFGHSMVVSPKGTILGECGEGEEVKVVDIDPCEVEASRKVYDSLRDRRPELYS